MITTTNTTQASRIAFPREGLDKEWVLAFRVKRDGDKYVSYRFQSDIEILDGVRLERLLPLGQRQIYYLLEKRVN